VRSPCNCHWLSALRYPFGGVGSNSIPSPVKLIQSQLISDEDGDEWEVIAEYATNNQLAMDTHDIAVDIYRHTENFMHKSGTIMQPDYVGKPEDLYLWCLIGKSKTCRQTEAVRVSESDALLLRMCHRHTDYRDKADT
jgi:hypothetical protein